MPNINFFDTYYMAGMIEEIVPQQTFFRDRYFPTPRVFDNDKVLVEYMDGDRKMAPFIAPRVGDIPVDRAGYELYEFTPPMVAPSRVLTIDELRKRGFGETMEANSTPADRARIIQLRDLTALSNRIIRREEWMAAQTMINNGVDVQEYIDAATVGQTIPIRFYDTSGSNPSIYTIGTVWTTYALMQADVEAMCDALAERGLPAEDLVLGSTVWSKVKQFDDIQNLLDKKYEYIGELRSRIIAPGVTHVGTLDFNGFMLNVLVVKETYTDESGVTQKFFPAKSAMVTAPACGTRYYGAITQIPYGSEDFDTFAQERVPKLIVDQEHDIRKLRVASRPLTAPNNKAPWIYAANAVT